MNITRTGDSKLEELVFHLTDDGFVKESHSKGFLKYQEKLEEFFRYIFEIVVEFKWEIRENYQDKDSETDVYTTKYSIFVGSRKMEFVSIENVNIDGLTVVRLKLSIKDKFSRSLFTIAHTYDYCEDYLEPRECGKEIYNFRYTLPVIMDKLEYYQGQ